MGPRLDLLSKIVQVGGHVLCERITSPVATGRADVPRDGTAVSVEWLTAVLCRQHPGTRVLGFTATPDSSGTSSRVRLRIRYNHDGVDAGLPEWIFVKASKTLAQRIIIGGSGALAGETRFFMDLLPRLNVEAPVGYWAAYNEASWRSVVLLEDIAYSKAAQFIEPVTSLTRGQVEDIVGLMAAYHGTFWNSPDLRAMKTPRDFLRRLSTFVNMRARAAVGHQRAQDVIPSSLHGQTDRIWQGTVRCLDIATDNLPPTLLHGDSHAGQTYLTGDGRMGLTDWQTCMRGGWAFDFTYFVTTACEPQDRRDWEKDLLRFYLDRLAQEGVVEVPRFEEAWRSYRQMVFYPLTAWTFTIGRAAYQPRMQPDSTCRALIHRLSTAVQDLDSFAAVGV